MSRIVSETHEGAFGLLPHRLDCVAALTPGILVYETEHAVREAATEFNADLRARLASAEELSAATHGPSDRPARK